MSNSFSIVSEAGRLLNSGQTRSIILTGNIYDLYPNSQNLDDEKKCQYVPITQLLCDQWNLEGIIVVVYEINGPIRFVNPSNLSKVRRAYVRWRAYETGKLGDSKGNANEAGRVFDESYRKATTNSALALELMRQMCACSRANGEQGAFLAENLIILIEGIDMIIPEAPITQISENDRSRVMICQDWFSDPGFANGNDSVVMIAESSSLVHHRVSRLPQVLEIESEAPDYQTRLGFIRWYRKKEQSSEGDLKFKLWSDEEALCDLSAGLSIHAINQLMKAASHFGETLTPEIVIAKVEKFIQSQVGEDVVEFKKPEHKLNDLVGFTKLKKFLQGELIPRFSTSGPEALPGAAISGPIGSGKTFIFEAVASEIGMVVLVLKSIRSKWYGETDLIFERLKRVLKALSKVLIFIDEADTQLGGVGADTMDTERRLTGKIQGMMSDPIMRGKVFWLLVTARIHLLSPDIRRPGRVGDLIIPILDPDGDDRKDFVKWMVGGCMDESLSDEECEKILEEASGFSSATFASLRSELKAVAYQKGGKLTVNEILDVLHDRLDPAIAETRRYQTLQALMNCTRRQLLPNPDVSEEDRLTWKQQIALLEAKGIS